MTEVGEMSTQVSTEVDRGGQLTLPGKASIFAANLTHLESQKAAIRFPTPPPQPKVVCGAGVGKTVGGWQQKSKGMGQGF